MSYEAGRLVFDEKENHWTGWLHFLGGSYLVKMRQNPLRNRDTHPTYLLFCDEAQIGAVWENLPKDPTSLEESSKFVGTIDSPFFSTLIQIYLLTKDKDFVVLWRRKRLG